jgi:NADPH:quinone reductase-like Zn-dependent oxidoreductase
MFEAMNRALVQHQAQPVVDRIFDFKETSAAYAHLQGETHFGKVVIAL